MIRIYFSTNYRVSSSLGRTLTELMRAFGEPASGWRREVTAAPLPQPTAIPEVLARSAFTVNGKPVVAELAMTRTGKAVNIDLGFAVPQVRYRLNSPGRDECPPPNPGPSAG